MKWHDLLPLYKKKNRNYYAIMLTQTKRIAFIKCEVKDIKTRGKAMSTTHTDQSEE